MKGIVQSVLGLGVLAMLGGCATTRGVTHLAVPQPGATVTQSNAKVIVIDSVRDARTFEVDPRDPSIPSLKPGAKYAMNAAQRETAIGRKRGGFGKAMGDWVLDGGQTVNSVTRELVATSLRSVGYKVVDATASGPGAEHVTVVINQFWAWFTPGFWTASIEAKIETRLDFTGPAGTRSVVANGYGRNQVQTGREANWQLAYDRAFKTYEVNLENAVR